MRGLDTLYVRLFDQGMVEVNPNLIAIDEIPPQDTRFTFWMPVQDLDATDFGPNRMRVEWTSPHGEEASPDSFELRYASTPITMETWDDATPYPGNPIEADPGQPISIVISGVPGGQSYYLATRSHTRGRLEPILSNTAETQVNGSSDLIPPGQISDPRSTRDEPRAISLVWTAQGDDGNVGTATRTIMRYLADAPIATELDWIRGSAVNGLPAPPPAGSADGFRISGLDADRLYGIAVRAVDEAGNVSPLSPPLTVRTADQPPPPPPDRSEGAIDGGGDGEGMEDGLRNPFADPRAGEGGDSPDAGRRFSLRGPTGAEPAHLTFVVQLPSEFRPGRSDPPHRERRGARGVAGG